MTTRRKFISQASLGSVIAMAGMVAGCEAKENVESQKGQPSEESREWPVVISTWGFGLQANREAMKELGKGGKALDAVEQGVRHIEADPSNSSVGIGGLPDREGKVTLDACIMGPDGNCGSVCAIEDILHPVTVARMVMEKTPHVILVGKGASDFALANGMEQTDLLTPRAKRDWEEWKVEAKYKPIINVENHDTIGMLAIDEDGDIAGACTTSGLAFKMRGRVGDSPIIGAGLYVDNEVGGATATGLGESVLRSCASFLVVELMRQGKSPNEACKTAVDRIIKLHPNYKDFQVGLIALNKAGEVGGYSIHEGFSFAKTSKLASEELATASFLSK